MKTRVKSGENMCKNWCKIGVVSTGVKKTRDFFGVKTGVKLV